jgi:zinc protease
VGSGLRSYEDAGTLVVATAVQADKTGPALGELLGEVRRLSKGDVTDDEAEKARAGVLAAGVQTWQSLAGAVGELAAPARYGLGPDTPRRERQGVAAWTPAALDRIAQKVVSLEGAVLVLVGDRATVAPQLQGLGLPAPRFLSAEEALDGQLPQ